MNVSLATIPEANTSVNPTYVDDLLDTAEVSGIEEGAFRRGNLRLVQRTSADTPVTPPFVAAATAPTLAGETVSLATPECVSFSGSGRDTRAFGMHVYGARETAIAATYKQGQPIWLRYHDDLRDLTVTNPYHGTVAFQGQLGRMPKLPLAVLDETSASADVYCRLTVRGLTRGAVRCDASGHTMLPGMPIYVTATGGTVMAEFLVADCSAYSMPAGYLCGQCLGLSLDATEALLPIEFWPYGLFKIPATGWSAYP